MEEQNDILSDEDVIEELVDGAPEDGILLAWQVPEFQQPKRGIKWWIIMSVIGIALMIQALLTANFVFAIILIMGGTLFLMTTQRKPELIAFIITVEGIVIGDRLYPYSDFTEFSVLYNPPGVKRLYLSRKRGVRNRMSIPLEETDPNDVREALGLFIQENIEDVEEPLSETLIRIAKF